MNQTLFIHGYIYKSWVLYQRFIFNCMYEMDFACCQEHLDDATVEWNSQFENSSRNVKCIVFLFNSIAIIIRKIRQVR